MSAALIPQKEVAALGAIQAIAEAIRDLGQVPEGHLYAQLMGHMTLEAFTAFLGIIERAGLISVQAHLITWIGPADWPQQS